MNVKSSKEADTSSGTNRFYDTGKRTVPVICPWCYKVFMLTKLKVEEGSRTQPAHGICPDCLKKVKS